MRLTIVTGNQPHMLYLCKKLSELYDIDAIFFFKTDKQIQSTRFGRLQTHFKKARRQGINNYLHSLKAYQPLKKKGHLLSMGYQEADDAFAEYSLDSIKIKGEIHHCEDINSAQTAAQIQALNSDLVVCHGGPIYRKNFIKAGKLVVNYHSGLSPVYNGAHSHVFALANGHPHLCGGTLMLMNESIDGGDILSHYLPEVGERETPRSMFYKNMLGSFELFADFLAYLKEYGNFTAITQPKALHYYTSKDWGMNNAISLTKHLAKPIPEPLRRDSLIKPYYQNRSKIEARQQMHQTLADLVLAS